MFLHTVTLKHVLKVLILPWVELALHVCVFFSFFKVVWIIVDLSHFPMGFKMSLSISKKKKLLLRVSL